MISTDRTGVASRRPKSLGVVALVSLMIVQSGCGWVRLEKDEVGVQPGDSAPAPAQALPEPANLDFETVSGHGEAPAAWNSDAQTGTDVEIKTSGERSAWLAPPVQSQGSLTQCTEGDGFGDRLVILAGDLRTEDADTLYGNSGAVMWIQAFHSSGRLYESADGGRAAYAESARVNGTRWWARYHVSLQIPEDVGTLCYGIRLFRGGKVWADALKLEIRG